MRKVSTLVGLTLLALASTARAEEAPPAEEKAAAQEGKAAAPEERAPAAAPTPTHEPASVAPSEGALAATPAPAETAASQRKLQLGLAFLPMSMGRYTYVKTTEPVAEEAHFAYGFGLSAVYEVLPGLLVGLAPQLTFNVRPKAATDSGKQIDVMARVAYAYRLPDRISVYAEVLPGYSMIFLPKGSAPKGFVLAFGAGCAMDLNERVFVSIGVGYQLGFTSHKLGATTAENRTRYLRVALGGGVRF